MEVFYFTINYLTNFYIFVKLLRYVVSRMSFPNIELSSEMSKLLILVFDPLMVKRKGSIAWGILYFANVQ